MRRRCPGTSALKPGSGCAAGWQLETGADGGAAQAEAARGQDRRRRVVGDHEIGPPLAQQAAPAFAQAGQRVRVEIADREQDLGQAGLRLRQSGGSVQEHRRLQQVDPVAPQQPARLHQVAQYVADSVAARDQGQRDRTQARRVTEAGAEFPAKVKVSHARQCSRSMAAPGG